MLDRRRLLALCAAAVAAFGLTAWATFHLPPAHDLDLHVLRDLSAHRKDTLGDIAGVLVFLGDPVPQILLLVGGIWVALASGRREPAIAGAVIVLGADLTTHFLKDLLAAPRPNGSGLPWGQIDGDAFPSGHTTAAFAMAAAWCIFVPSRRRRLAVAVGLTLACLVALSVVVLHHHYPSDAVGGFLVAAAWTWGVLAVCQRSPRTIAQ